MTWTAFAILAMFLQTTLKDEVFLNKDERRFPFLFVYCVCQPATGPENGNVISLLELQDQDKVVTKTIHYGLGAMGAKTFRQKT